MVLVMKREIAKVGTATDLNALSDHSNLLQAFDCKPQASKLSSF